MTESSNLKTRKITDYPFVVHLHSSDEVREKRDQAIEWLRAVGGSVHSDRYHGYLRSIDKYELSEVSVDIEREFYSFLNAHSELAELIRVYDSLQLIDSSEYVAALKKICSGQAFRNKVTNEASRDFLFELSVGARLIRAGYEVTLNGQADSVAIVEGRRVYVEAKRIRSVSQIGKRVGEANKQIGKRLAQDSSSKSRGFVAVSLTDVLNPDNSFAMVENVEHLRSTNAENLHGLVGGRDDFMRGKIGKCLGVLAEFTMQGFKYQNEGRESAALLNCRVATFRRYDAHESNNELMAKMLPVLSNQSLYK
jgi:hypothetical protein